MTGQAAADAIVTVIVPTYNRAPTLRITLESLRRQTLQDWVALVVGDGCTDGSGDVVQWMDDRRIRWHNRASNSGQSAWPINDALAVADTQWIAYLSHDDLWFPWHLEELLKTAEETGADFARAFTLGFAHIPDGDRMAIVSLYTDPPLGLGAEYGHLPPPFPPCAWLHRRSLIDAVGPWRYPDTLDAPPDHEFQRRAARAGVPFAFSRRLSGLYFPAVTSGRTYRNERAPASMAYAARLYTDAPNLETDLLRRLVSGIAAMLDGGQLPLPVDLASRLAKQADRLDREDLTSLAVDIGDALMAINLGTWRDHYAGRNTPEAVREYQELRAQRWKARGLEDAPAPPAPLAVRSVTLDRPSLAMAPEAGAPAANGRILLEVDGMAVPPVEPVVLVDGVPAPAVSTEVGWLSADLPATVPLDTEIQVQALSGGSVSPPVWVAV